MNSNISLWILRIFLILAGLTIIFTGINISLGGILTLGLQGTADFLTVTNPQRFLAQDSHIRFLGGVWFSIGALFVIGSFNMFKFETALKFSFMAVFIGGIARFSQMNLGVTLGPDILASLIAELVGMPVLFFWLSAIVKKSKAG